MEGGLSIDIELDGKEYSFDMRVVATGYVVKFYVLIDGIEVTYEPDEERNYRAIVADADRAKVTNTIGLLIKGVGEKIGSLK